MVIKIRKFISIIVPYLAIFMALFSVFIINEFIEISKDIYLGIEKLENVNFILFFGYFLIFIGGMHAYKNDSRGFKIATIAFLMAGYIFAFVKIIYISFSSLNEDVVKLGCSPISCSLGSFVLSLLSCSSILFLNDKKRNIL